MDLDLILLSKIVDISGGFENYYCGLTRTRELCSENFTRYPWSGPQTYIFARLVTQYQLGTKELDYHDTQG